MPLFDFFCDPCGRVIEDVLISVGGTAEVSCGECGALARRLPAAPAIRFVGYGWTAKTYRGGAGPSEHDTLEETEGGQLRDKTGAGHDAP